MLMPLFTFAVKYFLMKYTYEFTLTAFNPNIPTGNFYSQHLSFLEDIQDDKPPYYTFTSEHLNELTAPEEIWARGSFLLALFKGAYTVYHRPSYGSYQAMTVSLTRLFKGDSDITPQNTNEILPKRSFGTLSESPTEAHQLFIDANNTSMVIALATDHEDVQNLLLQIGYGIDWINLHSILDSIEFYAGKDNFEKLLTEAKYSKDDVKAFTGTVNNFGLLSIDARHGDMGWGVPKRTLTLDESRKLVLDLAFAYFKITYGLE
jgi:hypothetical protein